MGRKITVSFTAGELADYDNQSMKLFSNGSSTYWERHGKLESDKCVATPSDFLEAAGYGSFPEIECDEDARVIEEDWMEEDMELEIEL